MPERSAEDYLRAAQSAFWRAARARGSYVWHAFHERDMWWHLLRWAAAPPARQKKSM